MWDRHNIDPSSEQLGLATSPVYKFSWRETDSQADRYNCLLSNCNMV